MPRFGGRRLLKKCESGPAFHSARNRKPVYSADDGDGIADLAIYRAGTGQWIIRNSNGSGIRTETWGAPGLGDYPARR